MITSGNGQDTSAVKPFVTSATTYFTINFVSPDGSANTYTWNYLIAQ